MAGSIESIGFFIRFFIGFFFGFFIGVKQFPFCRGLTIGSVLNGEPCIETRGDSRPA